MTDTKRLPPGSRKPTTLHALSGIDEDVELGGRFAVSSLDQSVLPKTDLWPTGLNDYPDQTGYEINDLVPVGEPGEWEKAAELLARPKPRIIREDLAALSDSELRMARELWQGRMSDGGRGAAAAMEEVGAIEAELARRSLIVE